MSDRVPVEVCVKQLIMFAASVMVAWSTVPAAAQTTDTFDLKEWEVEWGGRTRDPYVAPDGKVWFVGQAGNYIA
jgi:virginiamycin B lyase